MSDFDQALYDAVMDGYPTDDDEIEGLDTHDMHYAMGRKAAAQDAARISAERQATVTVTDAVESAAKAMCENYEQVEWSEAGDDMQGHYRYLAELAVRQALGAWPQVPRWATVTIRFREGEWRVMLSGYKPTGHGFAPLYTSYRDTGPTLTAALQSAIDQIGGAE